MLPDENKGPIRQLCERVLSARQDAANIEGIPDPLVEEVIREIEFDVKSLDEIDRKLALKPSHSRGEFYDFFSLMDMLLSGSPACHQLMGRIWAHVYDSCSAEERITLLSGFNTDGDFFNQFHVLPSIVEHGEFTGEVLSDWLIEVGKTLGNDLASAPLWNALSIMAEKRPGLSVETLRLWIGGDLASQTISMAAHLLAALRFGSVQGVTEIDLSLKSSDSRNHRKTYYRSHQASDQLATLPGNDYRNLIEEMSGDSEEMDLECLHFIQATICNDKRCDNTFRIAIQWVIDNTHDSPSVLWGDTVPRLAFSTLQRSKTLGIEPLYKLVPKTLPIPESHSGTRRALDKLLVEIFGVNKTDFMSLMFSISERDSFTLNKLFDPHSHGYMQSAVSRSNVSQLISDCFSQRSNSARRVGIKFFQRSDIQELTPPAGTLWSEEQIASIIVQLSVESLYDETPARILVALEPYVRDSNSDDLKNLYKEHLIFHSKNFPGACLRYLREKSKKLKSRLIRQAMLDVESYLDQLTECSGSAINSARIAGLRRASQLLSNRRSREIQSASEGENSLVSLLTSKSYLLYGGGEWQMYYGGAFGEIAQTQEFSTSMEFPRMPMIDPDGYGEWRMTCGRMLRYFDRKADQNEF
ncbi:MAG: hypothetical protein P1U58_10945 [Verrucomicrobiales bacterium]|nr:hypothetical protein [Verrucomicrobiales bacterium]